MTDFYWVATEIRFLYRTGKITREEAKERMKPYIEHYNRKAKELADKYSQKYKPFNFSSFMR